MVNEIIDLNENIKGMLRREGKIFKRVRWIGKVKFYGRIYEIQNMVYKDLFCVFVWGGLFDR